MDLESIPQLDQLICETLPTKTVKEHKVSRLTSAGENYGSLMLSVQIVLEDKIDKSKTNLDVVAKLPPPNDYVQESFNTRVTFHNEIQFYKTIVPILQKFQKECGITNVINSFPKYYCSRYSLSESTDKIDDNAILILENLKISGYDVGDRILGFDFDTAKLIIQHLAKFQAIPIAIKQKNQEMFNQLSQLFKEYSVFLDQKTHLTKHTADQLVQILGDQHKLLKSSQKLIYETSENYFVVRNTRQLVQEPYHSISHADLWVNNVMLKFEEGRAVDCKFIDFQIYEVGPVAADLIFFILSSVQIPVVQQHFDKLVESYYETFINSLKEMKCDISHYSLPDFWAEVKKAFRTTEFFDVLTMLNITLAPKNQAVEVNDISSDYLVDEKPLPEEHKRRGAFIINFFGEKGWI